MIFIEIFRKLDDTMGISDGITSSTRDDHL